MKHFNVAVDRELVVSFSVLPSASVRATNLTCTNLLRDWKRSALALVRWLPPKASEKSHSNDCMQACGTALGKSWSYWVSIETSPN